MVKSAPIQTRRKPMIVLLVVILSVCVLWIGYQLFGGGGTPNIQVEPAVAPEVKESRELTAALNQDERFKSLGVHREDDGTWVCAGEVNNRADVVPAQQKAKELKPDAEWRFDIVPMNP